MSRNNRRCALIAAGLALGACAKTGDAEKGHEYFSGIQSDAGAADAGGRGLDAGAPGASEMDAATSSTRGQLDARTPLPHDSGATGMDAGKREPDAGEGELDAGNVGDAGEADAGAGDASSGDAGEHEPMCTLNKGQSADGVLAAFDDGSRLFVGSTIPGDGPRMWSRGAYGSSDTDTSDDGGWGPPADPSNLANLTLLTHEPSEGNPVAGAAKLSVPFREVAEKQTVQLVYFVGVEDERFRLEQRTLRARFKLLSGADSCAYSVTAWSTSSAKGSDWFFVGGKPTGLRTGTWVEAVFDVDLAAAPTLVTQLGFNLQATCSGTAQGGATANILVDDVRLSCE